MSRYQLALLLAYLANGFVLSQPSPFIHVDQFGYLNSAEKIGVMSNPQTGFNAGEIYQPGNTLELRDFLSEAIVFSGNPTLWKNGATHLQSGDKGWWFDFSGVSSSGTFYINDPDSGEKSAPFVINANPYVDVLKAALKMFYYNRCNAPKERPFAGPGWIDGNNFSHALQDANCRFILEPENVAKEKDLTGGWFDAGDYNKYVTFAHHPVHQLLWTYEDQPFLFSDDWNWPESGNGLPDILDEIKYELDWLLKMTNEDGTVHIKMGSTSFSHNNLAPPSINTDPRYYGPTCSSASVRLRACLPMQPTYSKVNRAWHHLLLN